MEENKTEKIIRIIFIITSVITFMVLLAYFVLKYLDQNKILPVPNETGAINSSLSASEKESYDELYNLMEQGEITSDYFKIKPLYQDRIVQIILKKPLSENKTKAETWLKQNGYGNIPTGKIIYLESTD